MREICRDCYYYCIHCGICHKDFSYKKLNDSCRDFTPEDGEESEVEE
jgi:hypothetical protein